MKLGHRAMQPKDINECVEIIATHPLNVQRYGPWFKHLADAWRLVVQTESGAPLVIQRGSDPNSPILMVGISVLVQDDLPWELKKPPHFWLGPELVRRITAGKPPLLTRHQLRDANSRDGLNLLVWEGCPRAEHQL